MNKSDSLIVHSSIGQEYEHILQRKVEEKKLAYLGKIRYSEFRNTTKYTLYHKVHYLHLN